MSWQKDCNTSKIMKHDQFYSTYSKAEEDIEPVTIYIIPVIPYNYFPYPLVKIMGNGTVCIKVG